MKEEDSRRLAEMYDFFKNYNNFSDVDSAQEVYEKIFIPNMEALATTKNIEVLEHLIDFFDEDFDCEVNEVCEILKSEIGANFTLDQIIQAFYKKFDSFAEKYTDMCTEMSMWCIRNRQIDDGHWDRFRKMFNTVKSKHSGKILKQLKEWFKYGWSKEERQMVLTLEEDIKNWR